VCRACEQVNRPTVDGHRGVCSRCGEALRWRKPESLVRAWMFLVLAALLYVPANVLPVLDTTQLGATQSNTILGGVRVLWRDGDLLKTQPVSPSVQDPSIKRYQTMIGADSQRVISSQSNNCASLADACPTAAANVVAALQQWLDDLDATRPPARFAYLDAQMRRHIPLAISGLNAAVTAYNAKDQAGMDNAINAAVNERDALEAEVNDIVASRLATNAAYKAVVRSDSANLLACTACQQLLSQNQVSCPASQTPSCPDQIAAASVWAATIREMREAGTLARGNGHAIKRFQLETFQGDVVHDFAPDSLVALDAHLQADLFAASVELSAMDSALSAGDAAALQNGHTLLRQALDRVTSDVANIALGN